MKKIRPAMTAEEWFDLLHTERKSPTPEGKIAALMDASGMTEEEARATFLAGAAEYLYTAGPVFTREDVERHESAAERERELFNLAGLGDDPEDDYVEVEALERAEWHESMAARIEALLPPEGGDGRPT